MAESVGSLLRERYGVFQIGHLAVSQTLASPDDTDEAATPRLYISPTGLRLLEGEGGEKGESLDVLLSEFARVHLRMRPDQQSVRPDRELLETFRHSSGAINVLHDPRLWVNANMLVQQLQDTHPQYRRLVDYVTEIMGLFIKPADYKNERNYWNAPTNAGLPVVKKKDVIHEGTFMLHDIFHFSIQDPLPASTGANPHALAIYLRHRMASEATTLVLTDMLAVDAAGLKSQGYDVSKRKIYPLFESIRDNLRGEDPQTVCRLLIEANIEFALTGKTDRFVQLGADQSALREYEDKYEVFFSADYDWNKSNWLHLEAEMAQNSHLRDYLNDVRDIFGIPSVEDLYPNGGSVDEIIASFVGQVSTAFAYEQPTDNELMRMRRSSTKYLGGQLIAFYRFASVEGTYDARHEFIDACKAIQLADNVNEVEANFERAVDIYTRHINQCATHGLIGPQEVSLYLLHAPLYPPLFINYALQAGDYRNLAAKMQTDGIY